MSQAAGPAGAASYREQFDRPIFVLSTPRSGSTLLFETLAQAPDLYTVGGEGLWLIEDILALCRFPVQSTGNGPEPAASLGLDWDLELGAELLLSKTTVSKPRADKWRRLEPLIDHILPIVAEADSQARSFLKQFRV